ncbi:MAG TPA: hypothetical protein VFE79_13035 [Paraburkholderia sp.]|jgi:hypothetical protein|nr:hypothetical protein [Paraburkholderia sp.]
MKRSRLATLAASVAFLTAAASNPAVFAQTTRHVQATPRDSGASMVKPPEAASGATGSSNPDNMPIKRPPKPTNDKMMRPPPASGANAR